MSGYDEGFRAGVMAERRRVILVALRALGRDKKPSDVGLSISHKIAQAGDMLPAPVPTEPESWSVFGERRLVRELPTILECEESPFTAMGVQHISRIKVRLDRFVASLNRVRGNILDGLE